MTSALKVTGVATKEISKKVKDGEDITGQSFAYGLKEGAVGIPSENPNLADGVYDKTMEVQKLIESGEVTPPSTEEEFNQFGNVFDRGDVLVVIGKSESVSKFEGIILA